MIHARKVLRTLAVRSPAQLPVRLEWRPGQPLARCEAYSSSSGKAPEDADKAAKHGEQGHGDKDAKASPFQGKLSIEGVLLPMDDAAALADDKASSIEARLQDRLKQKESSSALLTKTDEAGMFGSKPSDIAEQHASEAYRVEGSVDHLDTFQDVFRRLRRTGRDFDDRDVSDSMLKVMDYMKKKKSKEGGSGR
eukprot:TRINITY_DN29180_c0_g1_i1.p1 TRINITY_DN29180_c0_g1~~TRINITY_DN29180_c0_g1_i1.p1  ORF type:complete len:194 (+),score=51.60 TRINITY_DN29180_c0_g1_i1:59-640(+)